MQVHFDAMLRMMMYIDDTSDRGLVLNLTRMWNEEQELLVVKVIPTKQKIRRYERTSLDTGFYWKVHL
jgi:hypothetical protein